MKWVFRAGLLILAIGFVVGILVSASFKLTAIMIMLLGIGLMLFAMPFFLRINITLSEPRYLPPSIPPTQSEVKEEDDDPGWGDVPGKPFGDE